MTPFGSWKGNVWGKGHMRCHTNSIKLKLICRANGSRGHIRRGVISKGVGVISSTALGRGVRAQHVWGSFSDPEDREGPGLKRALHPSGLRWAPLLPWQSGPLVSECGSYAGKRTCSPLFRKRMKINDQGNPRRNNTETFARAIPRSFLEGACPPPLVLPWVHKISP